MQARIHDVDGTSLAIVIDTADRTEAQIQADILAYWADYRSEFPSRESAQFVAWMLSQLDNGFVILVDPEITDVALA
jgi:hypothetical protein